MKMSAGRLSLSIGCLILMLPAGTNAATAQQDESPVIRSTTRLVQLNVTVLDKLHHPISGLSQSDFQVFDNGREQKIADFSTSPAAGPPQQRSIRSISNRPGMGGAPSVVTVILVDETLLDGAAGAPLGLVAPIRSARLAILSFLAGLQPGEEVGIYSLHLHGIVVIHDFTQDPAALIAAAKSSLGEGGMGRGAAPADVRRLSGTLRDWSKGDIGNKGLGGYSGSLQEPSAIVRSGFLGILEHLREVPGRKNLVWISSTLPSTTRDLDLALMGGARDANLPHLPTLENPTPSPPHPKTEGNYEVLRDFARSLSSADISVYPIDAKGLTEKGSDNGEWSAADMIATETGGQAVFDSNALDQHLSEIVAQGSGSYQIGYYPGDSAWDGKYHHVEVKVAPAHQHATVLCRKEYLAVDQSASNDTDMPLEEAAKSVVEAPGVGMTVNVPMNPLEPGPEEIGLKLAFDNLQFERADGRAKANFDVAFFQLGPHGRIVASFKDTVRLSLTPKMYETAKSEGSFYRRKLWIDPRAEKLRVVVRDRATDALGSVSVPIHFLHSK